eukprot:TRINITY_DN7889_c0_g1_i2.p1 TRINITY_DN7889_c0_g1~~TRINITY_DN7889_c0_g1_i2.p1  ORF type:complete len:418 (+),score=64.18 TRINITY_DN7889_c0_g1_i2:169-1422(+)
MPSSPNRTPAFIGIALAAVIFLFVFTSNGRTPSAGMSNAVQTELTKRQISPLNADKETLSADRDNVQMSELVPVSGEPGAGPVDEQRENTAVGGKLTDNADAANDDGEGEGDDDDDGGIEDEVVGDDDDNPIIAIRLPSGLGHHERTIPQAHLQLVRPLITAMADKCGQPDHELIVGVMITGKDKEHEYLALRSTWSFFNQTHKSRILVVVNDSPDYSLRSDFFPCMVELGVPTDSGKLTLGALRNIGIGAVPLGVVWVQWDDDDWHEPSYISQQYTAMKQQRADGVVLTTQYRLVLGQNSSYFYYVRNGIMGTIMLRKTPAIRNVKYKPFPKREDSMFLRELRAANATVVPWTNPPWIYMRLFHGANTWSSRHFRVGKLSPNEWCRRMRNNRVKCTANENDIHHHVMRLYQDWPSQ